MGIDFAVLMQFILKLFEAFKKLIDKLGILNDSDPSENESDSDAANA